MLACRRRVGVEGDESDCERVFGKLRRSFEVDDDDESEFVSLPRGAVNALGW